MHRFVDKLPELEFSFTKFIHCTETLQSHVLDKQTFVLKHIHTVYIDPIVSHVVVSNNQSNRMYR